MKKIKLPPAQVLQEILYYAYTIELDPYNIIWALETGRLPNKIEWEFMKLTGAGRLSDLFARISPFSTFTYFIELIESGIETEKSLRKKRWFALNKKEIIEFLENPEILRWQPPKVRKKFGLENPF